jgi:hypothetical protein
VIVNFFSTPKITLFISIVFAGFFLIIGVVLAAVKME